MRYNINKFQYDIFARVKLNEILISFLISFHVVVDKIYI